MLSHIRRLLGKTFTRLVIISSSLLLIAQPALAVSSQRRGIERYPFYDKTAEQVCDGGTLGLPGDQAGNPGGGVYYLGDSIGEGLEQAGLKDQLEQAGYSALINADRSRSITGKGQTTGTNGLDALNANASFIQTAKIVIVELGTNPENNFAANLDNLIGRIAAINGSAKVYFVDVAASPQAATRIGAAATNNVIYDRAAKLGTSVISRFKLYYPNGDPRTYAGATAPVLPFDSLGVHSTSQADYQKLNDLIKTTIGKPLPNSSSGVVCVCPTAIGAIDSNIVNLNGATNLEKAYNYFVSKGLTPEQAAGALGNMMQESSPNLDPQLVQGGGRSQDPRAAGSGGYGIIQWTPGSKILGVAQTAGITGPIYELSTQLDIVWWHMGNSSPTGYRNMLAKYKAITSVEEAVTFFESSMEAAGIKVIQKRIAYARQALARFGAGTSGAATPGSATQTGTTPAAQSNCTSTNTGASGGAGGGFTLENVVYYNQCDPAWASKPYGSSSICKSGCGPTSLAIVISTLNKTRTLPDEVASYNASRGFYIAGDGTSWAAFTETPKRYGLKGRDIGKSLDAVKQTLAAGGLVIASFGPGHFTGGGHILVIRSIDENGKIYVADPNDSKDLRKSKTAWDPAIIMAESKNFWAITK